jgi:hypothetical protein
MLAGSRIFRPNVLRADDIHRRATSKNDWNHGFTVAGICRSRFYQPLAVLLAALMLPAASWLEFRGTGPFQANAQTSVTVTSLQCSAALVAPGNTPTCTITLSAAPQPNQPLTVSIVVNGSALGAPQSVTITSGTTVNFNATAQPVSSDQTDTITASLNGSSQTFTMQVVLALVTGCNSTGNSIFQNYCVNGVGYFSDLAQLESDAVNASLAIHNLPATDAHLIYDTGRLDLRSEVRATMLSILLGIILKPTASRSTHEQTLFTWFQNLVQNNEISLYQNAVNQYQAFVNDPCTFTLDSVIAAQFNLQYNGAAFCGVSESSVFGVPVPSESYFTTYGFSRSYGAQALTDSNFGSIVSYTGFSLGSIVGISFSTALISSILAGSVLYANLAEAAAAFIADGATSSAATINGFAISGSSVNSIGVGAGVAGPVAIIFTCVVIGVIAGMEAFNNQQAIDELNGLSTTLTNVTNNQPDLTAMVTDSSGLGMYKLVATLDSQTSPDIPSPSVLPQHQSGTDLSFTITPSGGSTAVNDSAMYQDWNGNSWFMQTSGGWFVQTCSTGSGLPCPLTESITATLRYVDWTGVKWTASRVGTTFINTKASPASTDMPCSADPATGISFPPSGNFETCSTYVSVFIPLTSGGSDYILGLTQLAQPHFNLPTGSLQFSDGTPSAQTIMATGNPTPTICLISGPTLSDFTVNSGCGGNNFQVAFDGLVNAPPGTYTMQLKVSNSLNTFTQTIPLTITDNLNIVSSSSFGGTWGVPFSFTVVATGNPTPKLSLNPGRFDLTGLTFTDDGNGTGTLSGTWRGSRFGGQSCLAVPITNCGGFIATNSQGTVVQNISPSFAMAPGAVMNTGSATFIAGVQNSLSLSWSGAVTPVTWGYNPDPNASWLQFTSNSNGTATLSGVPPIGVSGTFQPGITALAQGTEQAIFPFPVTVVDTPDITSANTATFTVGTSTAFNLVVNTGSPSTNGLLPNGLTLSPGGTLSCLFTPCIAGTPAAGTGGQYTVLLTDTATTGATTQNLTLYVDQAPTITSPNLVTLFAGVPANVVVTTLGFPNESSHAVTLTSPPTDPKRGNGMYFSVSGLPASLQSSNLNSAGFATGTLSISGTPAAGDVGTHKVQITAQNAVGSPAQQTLTVQVLPFTPTSAVDLVSTTTLARDVNQNVVATVVVANGGSSAAQNVAITSAKIGSVGGTVSPVSVASIGSASSATFTVTFPGSSLGASGTLTSLILSGSYNGGTFNSGGRIVLP